MQVLFELAFTMKEMTMPKMDSLLLMKGCGSWRLSYDPSRSYKLFASALCAMIFPWRVGHSETGGSEEEKETNDQGMGVVTLCPATGGFPLPHLSTGSGAREQNQLTLPPFQIPPNMYGSTWLGYD